MESDKATAQQGRPAPHNEDKQIVINNYCNCDLSGVVTALNQISMVLQKLLELNQNNTITPEEAESLARPRINKLKDIKE